jgi:hypothetical protein
MLPPGREMMVGRGGRAVGRLLRHSLMNAVGPRIAAEKWRDVFPTALAASPWEDIRRDA